MHKNKERKKKTKGKYQTELLERIVTKTFFLIHHDLLNVQTFTQWKPDASKIFITGRTSNCSFTVMSETDMWNMETKNQYRNENLPIVTSHFSNWTFVVTKTWNDLKPPKTIYNHLQPPQKIQQPPTTIYNHLKNIYNHSQTI